MSDVWIGSPANSARRIDFYSGQTNGSGAYTVVYPTPFPAGKIPSVQPSLTNPSTGRRFRVSASTETGFTVIVEDPVSVVVLSVSVLGVGVTTVPSQAMTVVVVSQD